MPKFIRLNEDEAVNLDSVSQVSRLNGRSMVFIDDRTIIADIPYETMLGLLNANAQAREDFQDSNIRQSLEGFLNHYGQPQP